VRDSLREASQAYVLVPSERSGLLLKGDAIKNCVAMQWYYADNGIQTGPVSDPELQHLLAAGKITSETLVWQEGMSGWKPYGVARGAAATIAVSEDHALCAECGKEFSREDMIQYKDSWICAACKPIFFQRLKEGGIAAGTLEYAGFGLRFGAKFVDGIILFTANQVINFSLGASVIGSRHRSGFLAMQGLALLVNILLGAAYSTWFNGKFGATPGKMALKLRIVRPDGSPITYGRALGRHFAETISSFILFFGYLMVIWDDERRSLHDRICDTRVIRISS